MIMTIMLSGWSLPSLLLAFLQHQAEFCLCFHTPFLNLLFHMSPPYLPIYGIYLPSLTKTFMYHLKIYSKFPFCNCTSSWCGERKSVSSMPKMFPFCNCTFMYQTMPSSHLFHNL